MRGGDQRMLRGVYVGHHERSSPSHARWSEEGIENCENVGARKIGIPWQLRPHQQNLAGPVVPEAEADQGVAPVIVMRVAPRTDRRRYVTKREIS